MVFQDTPLDAEAEQEQLGEPEPRFAEPTSPASTVATTAEPRLDGTRVAMINWRDPWQAAAGGAEEYAWRMCQHLIGRGAHVTFLTSREPGQSRTETVRGVTLRRMGGRFTVYMWVLLWLLLHRRRFDIALDCMNGIPFFSRLVLPSRTHVVSVVHHVHDLQFCAYFSRPVAWLGRFIEGPVASWVYRCCPTVTVSNSSRQAMRDKLGWRAPISVIHNGAPPVPTPEPETVGLQTPTVPSVPTVPTVPSVPSVPTVPSARPEPEELGSPALVSLGRLVVQKRVTRLVDVVADLQQDWPELRAHIVGRGPQREPLTQRTHELGLSGRIVLHGFVPQQVRDDLLARAHLHVTAAEFEGWGLTVLEAAALGVPTVAYDVDGLRDSVRDRVTGWLVRDGQSLSQVVDAALRELADPRRAAEISRACQQWAASFTWERSGREMTWLLAGLSR